MEDDEKTKEYEHKLKNFLDGQIQCCELLIKHGLSADLATNDGISVVHLALMNGNDTLSKYLLSKTNQIGGIHKKDGKSTLSFLVKSLPKFCLPQSKTTFSKTLQDLCKADLKEIKLQASKRNESGMTPFLAMIQKIVKWKDTYEENKESFSNDKTEKIAKKMLQTMVQEVKAAVPIFADTIGIDITERAGLQRGEWQKNQIKTRMA